jgi:hypothetical protein
VNLKNINQSLDTLLDDIDEYAFLNIETLLFDLPPFL